jgi:DNA-binding response OmpR family regulator
MNKPIIFLLEEDNDSRPLLKKALQNRGYKVLLSVEAEDALQRVDDGLLSSDLLMVNLLRKTEFEMLDFGNLLLEKASLNIPVVTVAAKYGKELEGTTVQVRENQYIVYMENGDELFDLLSRLTQTKAPTLLFSGINELQPVPICSDI